MKIHDEKDVYKILKKLYQEPKKREKKILEIAYSSFSFLSKYSALTEEYPLNREKILLFFMSNLYGIALEENSTRKEILLKNPDKRGAEGEFLAICAIYHLKYASRPIQNEEASYEIVASPLSNSSYSSYVKKKANNSEYKTALESLLEKEVFVHFFSKISDQVLFKISELPVSKFSFNELFSLDKAPNIFRLKFVVSSFSLCQYEYVGQDKMHTPFYEIYATKVESSSLFFSPVKLIYYGHRLPFKTENEYCALVFPQKKEEGTLTFITEDPILKSRKIRISKAKNNSFLHHLNKPDLKLKEILELMKNFLRFVLKNNNFKIILLFSLIAKKNAIFNSILYGRSNMGKCLESSHLVKNSKGDLIMLKNIKKGDKILSWNLNANNLQYKEILEKSITLISTVIEIKLENGCVLKASREHRLFTILNNEILTLEAKDFATGSELLFLSFSKRLVPKKIISMITKHLDTRIEMVDLQIKDNHNFFVEGILSHNSMLLYGAEEVLPDKFSTIDCNLISSAGLYGKQLSTSEEDSVASLGLLSLPEKKIVCFDRLQAMPEDLRNKLYSTLEEGVAYITSGVQKSKIEINTPFIFSINTTSFLEENQRLFYFTQRFPLPFLSRIDYFTEVDLPVEDIILSKDYFKKMFSNSSPFLTLEDREYLLKAEELEVVLSSQDKTMALELLSRHSPSKKIIENRRIRTYFKTIILFCKLSLQKTRTFQIIENALAFITQNSILKKESIDLTEEYGEEKSILESYEQKVLKILRNSRNKQKNRDELQIYINDFILLEKVLAQLSFSKKITLTKKVVKLKGK